MPDKHPFHSDNSFVKGENAVQTFVDAAHAVTEEERNRPRYGRPVRKPAADARPDSVQPSDHPVPPNS
jgi:hypothetical protein